VLRTSPKMDELVAEDALPYGERPLWPYTVGALSAIRVPARCLRRLRWCRRSWGCDWKWLAPSARPSWSMNCSIPPAAIRPFPRATGSSAVSALLSRARLGLVVLQPEPNYVGAVATKMYEYLAVGIPTVASDFLSQSIPDGVGVIPVDPLDPSAIAEAVEWLLRNPAEAEAIGERGRALVRSSRSWESQVPNLLELYASLVTTSSVTRD